MGYDGRLLDPLYDYWYIDENNVHLFTVVR